MKKLHVESKNDIFVPEEGQRGSACSNKESSRCPSFGIKNPNEVDEDVALNYFAGILVEAFLDKKEYERNKLQSQKSSGVHSSVNKRTSG